MNQVNPTTAYWTKIVIGVAAFIVWLGSVTVLPGAASTLFVIAAPYQQLLFAAAAGSFGWAVTQGSTAVSIAAEYKKS